MVSIASSSQTSLRSASFDAKSVDNGTLHKSGRSWSIWGNDRGEANSKRSNTTEEALLRIKNSRERVNEENNMDLSNSSVRSKNSIRSRDTGRAKSHNVNEVLAKEGDHSRNDQTPQLGGQVQTLKKDNEGATKQRTWFFWNRNTITDHNTTTKDIEQVITPPKSCDLITNTIIPYSDSDAILIKGEPNTIPCEHGNIVNMENEHPNIVVPSFDILPQQTTWTNISNFINKLAYNCNFISSKSLHEKCLHQRGPQESLKKLSNNRNTPVKVLIIGVHGFFPTKMIRPFIGEPTGTSIKFILEAEKVVAQYFKNNFTDIQISKIALEREGEVLDRVNFFFDTMKNWIEEINKADFIYFVAHSQGCPVTILLLAKLIDAGIIDLDSVMFSNQKVSSRTKKNKIIAILAMAGINNGPFYGADQTLFVRAYQTIERESLRELFQFQKFDSLLSRELIRSLRIIIRSGVKITFIGSINDQLVPLYSSICLFAHHPNIFRATFIDSDSRTPNFITRLVKIAGTLINWGYDDHGIIKEISGALAGTLTGGGHSTVYNESQVYEIGLKFALETTDCFAETPIEYRPFKLDQLGANPFHLPWCMRGLLYETGKRLNEEEIHQLFKEFEEWEPETKQLKDIKFRLNGLKSKL